MTGTPRTADYSADPSAGRPVIRPNLPILDSHHHFMEGGGRTYSPDDYRADTTSGHHVVGSVYVEMKTRFRTDGPKLLRPVGEVEYVEAVASSALSTRRGDPGVAAAIIGYADLEAGDPVGELLDRCLAASPQRYRGVRQSVFDLAAARSHPHPFRWADPNPFGSASFRRGVKQVAERGLIFEAAVVADQMGSVVAIADRFPSMTIVLNHMAPPVLIDLPMTTRQAALQRWERALSQVALRPNVVCKVGGLGMRIWAFNETRTGPAGDAEVLARTWEPLITTALRAFGADRCLMESNFPIDSQACDYATLWDALKLSTRKLSESEVHALFHDNALRIYGLTRAT